MPRGDGTGPFGFSPLTGRGFGQCRKSFWQAGGFNKKNVGQLGTYIPFIGAVLLDIINPNGLLRIVSRKLLSISNRKPDQIKNIVNADFVVLDEKADENSKNENAIKKQVN